MDRWLGSDRPEPMRLTVLGLVGVEGGLEVYELVELTDIIEEMDEIESRWFAGKGVVKWAVSD